MFMVDIHFNVNYLLKINIMICYCVQLVDVNQSMINANIIMIIVSLTPFIATVAKCSFVDQKFRILILSKISCWVQFIKI